MDLHRMNVVSFKISSYTELVIFFVVHAIAMSSSVTNPVLYGWLNSNLKHLFRAMIPYLKGNEARNNNTNNLIELATINHEHEPLLEQNGNGGGGGSGGGGGPVEEERQEDREQQEQEQQPQEQKPAEDNNICAV